MPYIAKDMYRVARVLEHAQQRWAPQSVVEAAKNLIAELGNELQLRRAHEQQHRGATAAEPTQGPAPDKPAPERREPAADVVQPAAENAIGLTPDSGPSDGVGEAPAVDEPPQLTEDDLPF